VVQHCTPVASVRSGGALATGQGLLGGAGGAHPAVALCLGSYNTCCGAAVCAGGAGDANLP
jgi:hypothetical protein